MLIINNPANKPVAESPLPKVVLNGSNIKTKVINVEPNITNHPNNST